MKKVILTKIYRSNKDKKGNPLMTQDGRSYERVSIKTTEHGNAWISGFGNESNKNWKEGDEVELEIVSSGEYLNFKMPNKADYINDKIFQIEARIKRLELAIEELQNKDDNIESQPDEEIDEAPF